MPRPRRVLASVDTDRTNQSFICAVRVGAALCRTAYMFNIPPPPLSLFFLGDRKSNPKCHCHCVLQCNHPPHAFFPLHPSLLSISPPRLSFFTLHTWVSWHKVPRLHVAPPSSPLHRHQPNPPSPFPRNRQIKA